MPGTALSRGSQRTADRASLRTVREVLRRRGDRLGASEMAYRIYMGAMLALILVAPVVRVAVMSLQDAVPRSSGAGGANAEVLGTFTPAHAIALLLTLGTALLVLAGSQIGPARASLAQLDLLYTTPISRARLLRPTVSRWLGIGAALGSVVAGTAIAAFALQPSAAGAAGAAGVAGFDWGDGLWLILAAMSLGILMTVAPLIGQLGRPSRAVAVGLLAALAAWQVFGEPGGGDPWMNVARMLFGAEPDVPAMWVSLTLAGGAVVAAPLLAARISREQLREAAMRLDSLQTLVFSGDPAAGLARLGAPVRLGRQWRLRPGRGLARTVTGMVVMRDLLGMVRAPGRSLAAVLGVLISGVLWAGALGVLSGLKLGGAVLGGAALSGVDPGTPDAPGQWLAPVVMAALLGAIAAVLAYISTSAWCRGLRAAAQASGSPPMLPVSPGMLTLRHALAPAVITAMVFTGGIFLAGAIGVCCSADWLPGVWFLSDGWPNGGSLTSTLPGVDLLIYSAVTTATVVVAMRASTALKGPIPLRLLAPIPTPAGDAAGINIMLWLLDGQIMTAFLGAGLAVLWGFALGGAVSPLGAGVTAVLVLAAVVLSARVRLGKPVA